MIPGRSVFVTQDIFLHPGDVPEYPPGERCKSYRNYEKSVCQDFMKLCEPARGDGVGKVQGHQGQSEKNQEGIVANRTGKVKIEQAVQ